MSPDLSAIVSKNNNVRVCRRRVQYEDITAVLSQQNKNYLTLRRSRFVILGENHRQKGQKPHNLIYHNPPRYPSL